MFGRSSLEEVTRLETYLAMEKATPPQEWPWFLPADPPRGWLGEPQSLPSGSLTGFVSGHSSSSGVGSTWL